MVLGLFEIFLVKREFLYGLVLQIAVLFALYFYAKDWKNLIWQTLILLIGLRLSFDSVVLPHKLQGVKYQHLKEEAIRIAENYKDKELVIYKAAPIDHSSSHYLTLIQNRIIPRVADKFTDTTHYYIIDRNHMQADSFIVLDSLPQDWLNDYLYIAK